MERIGHIGSHYGAEALIPAKLDPAQQREAQNGQTTGQLKGDQADISEMGRVLAQAHDDPGVRADRVSAVRQAIEEDPEGFIRERMNTTINRLVDDLAGE
jgi:anti-sigma28 factor (negative regulator of flagellin synthesis)